MLSHTAITHVLRGKKRARWWGEYCTVLYVREQPSMQLGCALARKKLKSSVHRHKLYRIWKEMVRHHKSSFQEMHLVILLKAKITVFDPIKAWQDAHRFRQFILALTPSAIQ